MTPAVHPERILKDLHALWITLGDEEGGAGGGVLRACALTLIVIEEDGARADPAGETLAELMRDHPSRTIVVRVRRGQDELLEARVFAQCWLPFGRRKQICSEQIEITAGEVRLGDVAPVLLALAAPDLPVVVWRRSASVARMPGIERVEALAGKVILDSEPAAGLPPAPGAGAVVSDLAWTRLTGFRQTVAQAIEGAQPGDIGEVRISHGVGAVPVSAWYMAGWMATALGWATDDRRLSFAAGGFDGVDLAGSGLAISLRRTGERERSDAELIGEELSIPGRDPVYERSLAAALSIAGRVR